jgi:hypothetical protein
VSQSDSVYFDGRMLDGALTLVFSTGEIPDAGYAVTIPDGYLWRNGDRVANVRALTYDRDALGWWIEYTSWRGTPLDSATLPIEANETEPPEPTED